MNNSRVSGILLHPTSLPSEFGIGDLGQEAYNFVDFLEVSYQQIWQILPLGPTGYGNSPYLAYSAFAGNSLLISLEKLQEEELLSEEDLVSMPEFSTEKVDYDLVIATKIPLLKQASQRFFARASPARKNAFQVFCHNQTNWLDDYALFMALKEAFDGAQWTAWERDIAWRQSSAIQNWQQQLEAEILHHKYCQFAFFEQWWSLKSYANQKGIKIFGDIPIYVAPDSADVWANPEIFCLDEETGKPELMAGVPPDYFSATGQLWGNPVYNWEKLQQDDFQWWIERTKTTFEYVDILRIDHFRGFQAFWAVPGTEEVATNGEWIEAPGEAFFTLLLDKLGQLPIIAEDLGVITPEVETLRDQFGFPGMKILHFAFDSDRENLFLPYNFQTQNCVAYTGTHDNDTTVGWFNARSPEEQQKVVDYLGCIDSRGIHWSLIRLTLSSIADYAIIPMQDILGLGSAARMNFPSTVEGNWSWRYRPEAINSNLCDYLRQITFTYGRAPNTTTQTQTPDQE